VNERQDSAQPPPRERQLLVAVAFEVGAAAFAAAVVAAAVAAVVVAAAVAGAAGAEVAVDAVAAAAGVSGSIQIYLASSAWDTQDTDWAADIRRTAVELREAGCRQHLLEASRHQACRLPDNMHSEVCDKVCTDAVR